MVKRYSLFWIVLLAVAITNATLRETVYGVTLGELAAHQVSTLTGIAFTGLAVWLFSRRYPISSARQAAGIGCVWLGLTLAFEFLFGHYVAGHPWSRLLHDYDLLAGRVWVLFLAWIAILPYLVYRARLPK